MTNKQIAEKFANGATNGQNTSKSMFIDGDKIYSYGYHFVIATRTANGFDFTNRKYSNTTAKHKNDTLKALEATGQTVTRVDDLK